MPRSFCPQSCVSCGRWSSWSPQPWWTRSRWGLGLSQPVGACWRLGVWGTWWQLTTEFLHDASHASPSRPRLYIYIHMITNSKTARPQTHELPKKNITFYTYIYIYTWYISISYRFLTALENHPKIFISIILLGTRHPALHPPPRKESPETAAVCKLSWCAHASKVHPE